ncbi:UTP11-like, U3 small nucleolar ribonucleoprotein [Chytridiales sp. JEL 0842]|nr:UTP11-like, U3 small nucleolar ribonucleoprotein [Chytridiales sp. JEL 0842]
MPKKTLPPAYPTNPPVPRSPQRILLGLLALVLVGAIVLHHRATWSASWFLTSISFSLPDLGLGGAGKNFAANHHELSTRSIGKTIDGIVGTVTGSPSSSSSSSDTSMAGGIATKVKTFASLNVQIGFHSICTTSTTTGASDSSSGSCLPQPPCGVFCGLWSAGRVTTWITTVSLYISLIFVLYALVRGMHSLFRAPHQPPIRWLRALQGLFGFCVLMSCIAVGLAFALRPRVSEMLQKLDDAGWAPKDDAGWAPKDNTDLIDVDDVKFGASPWMMMGAGVLEILSGVGAGLIVRKAMREIAEIVSKDMSSLRKAIPQKTHRERSQLKSREGLGLLEKKKDYTLRSRDFKDKQKRIKAMKEKAMFRNPDEFYFGMINAKTKGGVAKKERNQQFDAETLKLLKTQDQGYVNYHRSINLKKLEKMKHSFHFTDDADTQMKEYTGEEEEEEEGEDEDDIATSANKSKPKHTIFVDDEDEARHFDPAAHFNTPPELLSRRFNRPRASTLEEAESMIPTGQLAERVQTLRSKTERELKSREDREAKLRKLQMEMEQQKNLMGKGSKKKVGVDKNGLAIYKWKQERKR